MKKNSTTDMMVSLSIADLSIINVSAPTCRHKDIPRFAFMYGANGFPIPADSGLIAYDDATRLYLLAQPDRTV